MPGDGEGKRAAGEKRVWLEKSNMRIPVVLELFCTLTKGGGHTNLHVIQLTELNTYTQRNEYK